MFIREDWVLFRNMDTLPQKAGVTIEKMGLLIAKELADNALDSCGNCEVGCIGNNGFYVKDNGTGIDIEKLPELFSINRPLISSKLLRLPTRGAMGNGLRVVCGAVAATNGKLYVSTKGKRYKMVIQSDGRTLAEVVDDYDDTGTLIEVYLGNSVRTNLSWAKDAVRFSCGNYYKGKTSGYWYTSEAFYELLQGYDGNVRDLIVEFDGCTGSKAGKINSDFKNRKSNTLSFDEADNLLYMIRTNSRKVKADRLGDIGEIDGYGYYQTSGEFNINSAKGNFNAEIPFVVEAWVDYSKRKDLTVLVNKTPITADMWLPDNKNKISIYGCEIYEDLNIKPANIILNIITPYMPITSDGKAPDMSKFVVEIVQAINKAGNRDKKFDVVIGKSISQKDIVLNNLQAAIAKASGDGNYRFSQRQLYYAVRPYVISEKGKQLEYGYFCNDIITNYETENGDIPLMYRDERGTLYHPHLKQDISVGTVAVENYDRPKWTFNKVLYIEKEGFFNVLKERKIPEKYDMALLTSKGYASRAVKDLLDTMGEESEEEITFFCIHDADAAGTKIFDTLQNETKARPGRKVKIINLGLDPEEAVAMGLEMEDAEKTKKKKAVADYIELKWQTWLQSKRVELNAMSTPQFIDWLEQKIQMYDKGKVIPPEAVIKDELDANIKQQISTIIKDKILEENNFQEQVNKSFLEIRGTYADSISNVRNDVRDGLKQAPTKAWIDIVDSISKDVINQNFKNCDF